MPLISLAMIVKDEEAVLAHCLKSVEGLVDEIIIVDTGSRDKTLDIAQAFGAQVHHFKWCDDFAAARNESLKYCVNPWILILDADEAIDPLDYEKIKDACLHPVA
ncbi:MAG: glycosyltransferase family 2 protein, partial [Holophagales bacterium]|nr:glycosyltransferase family 2 protein [Holophagales bacterium]